MFTVKRIIDGDVSLSTREEVTISKTGGKLFKEAVKRALTPTVMETDAESALVAESTPGSVSISGSVTLQSQGITFSGTLETKADTAYEITGVQERRSITDYKAEPFYSTSVVPGHRHVSEAIGVLVTHTNDNEDIVVEYDFFYRGDEVYVMNSEGKTVYDLR